MWICMSDSFVSIVDKGDPSGRTLLVRARKAGDIEKVFPGAEAVADAGTDYAFRARIDRSEVAERIADAIRGIAYGNFKSSVRESQRHDVYMDVWSDLLRLQAEAR
jgi:hypothetical protein